MLTPEDWREKLDDLHAKYLEQMRRADSLSRELGELKAERLELKVEDAEMENND